MSTLKSVHSNPAHTHEGAANPTQSVVGAKVDDVYLQLTSGEQFRCSVDTFGSQKWHGNKGSAVGGVPAVLATTHPDLVTMYTMDNIVSTTLVDETINGNDGTIVGAPAVVQGILGSTLDFTGVTDGVNSAATAVHEGASGAISIWVRFEDLASRRTLMSDGAGTQVFIEKDASNNFRAFSGTVTLTTGAIAPLNTWTHVTYVYGDSGFDRLYVNGVDTANAATGGGVSGAGNIEWGKWASPYLDGQLDQIRTFSRALTQQEVTDLYNEYDPTSILATTHPNLEVMYTMDNISGATLVDETLNNNDAVHTTSLVTAQGLFANALDTSSLSSGHAQSAQILGPSDTAGSFSYWMKHTALDGSFTQSASVRGTGNARITLDVSSTAGTFQMFNNVATMWRATFPTGSILDGNWHHIVMQGDGSAHYVYVDGVLMSLNYQAGGAGNGWWGANDGNTGALRVGESLFDGHTDQYRYFNRLLTQSEVTALYAEGIPATSTYVSYTMDSILGNLLKSEVAGSDLIITEGLVVPGVTGNAISSFRDREYIEDVSGYIPLDTWATAGTPFSVTFWLKYSASIHHSTDSVRQSVVMHDGSFAVELQDPGQTTTNPTIYIDGSVFAVQAPQYLTAGKWHHLAVRSTGSTIEVLIDGIQQPTEAVGTKKPVTSTNFCIGDTGSSAGGIFHIDELTIYNGALSDATVLSEYQAVTPPVFPGTSIAAFTLDSTYNLPAGHGSSLEISPDGTKMLVKGDGIIVQYTLSTPYDITTAVDSGVSLDITGQGASVFSIRYNFDGSALITTYTNVFYQYTLPTNYSLVGATYSGLSNGPFTAVNRVEFNPTGTGGTVWVSGDNNLEPVTLSDPNDITTMAYIGSGQEYSIGAVDTMRSHQIYNSGFSLLLSGASSTVYEASLSSAYDIKTTALNMISLDVSKGSTVQLLSTTYVESQDVLYVLTLDGGGGTYVDKYTR